MSGLPAHVHSLLGVGPYRQPAGRDPVPKLLLPGHERIELVTGGRGWIHRHAHEGGGWAEVTSGSIAWQQEQQRRRERRADPPRGGGPVQRGRDGGRAGAESAPTCHVRAVLGDMGEWGDLF